MAHDVFQDFKQGVIQFQGCSGPEVSSLYLHSNNYSAASKLQLTTSLLTLGFCSPAAHLTSRPFHILNLVFSGTNGIDQLDVPPQSSACLRTCFLEYSHTHSEIGLESLDRVEAQDIYPRTVRTLRQQPMCSEMSDLDSRLRGCHTDWSQRQRSVNHTRFTSPLLSSCCQCSFFSLSHFP
jgi:hypothetical protein